MKGILFNQQKCVRKLRTLSVLFALLMLPQGIWAEEYELYIGSTQITSENIGDYPGLSFDNDFANKTITLDGLHLTEPLSWRYHDEHLTVVIKGSNSIITDEDFSISCEFGSYAMYGSSITSEVTFVKGSDACELKLRSKDASYGPIWGFYRDPEYTNVKIVSDYTDDNGRTLIIGTSYLTVAGKEVHISNASNVTGDEISQISYDSSTNTLTLTGCQFDGDYYNNPPFVHIPSNMSSLNVYILGWVRVENCSHLFVADGPCTVNLSTDATVPGELLFKGADLKNEVVTIDYGSNLDLYPGTSSQYIIPKSGMFYCDYFGVYNYEPNTNIYPGYPGRASTNYRWYFSNTLATNNNLNLMPTVTSSLADDGSYVSRMRVFDEKYSVINNLILQFDWVGTNHNVTVEMKSLDGQTTYATGNMSQDNTVSLALSKPVSFNHFCLTFTSSSEFSFLPLAVKVDKTQRYNLVVAGMPVYSENATDVFGDGKVSFTQNTNTLALKGVNFAFSGGNGIDYVAVQSELNNLNIRLEGDNSIICRGVGDIAFRGTTADAKVAFISDESSPGTLYLATYPDMVFKDITPSYQGLTYSQTGTIQEYNENTITFCNLSRAGIYKIPWEGAGNETNPYLIKSTTDLDDMAKYVNKGFVGSQYFKLSNDLDYTGNTGYVPIGYSSNSFTGTLDGDGHIIKGIVYNPNNIDPQTSDGIGLFGDLSGTAKNIKLYNCKFGGGYVNGAIAEFLRTGGTIDNCIVTACTISSDGGNGGIVGYLSGLDDVNKTTIKNCTVTNSTIEGSGSLGGIASFTEDLSYIEGCTVVGNTITSKNVVAEIGGIAATSNGNIKNCTVKSTVIICGDESATGGYPSVAGAITGNYIDPNSIENNYYYGDVTIKTQASADQEPVVSKDGHTQRGTGTQDATTGNYDIFKNNGAVLYTKTLDLPAEDATCSVSEVAGAYYQKTGDNVISVAPDLTTQVKVTPKGDYIPSAVSVSYTTADAAGPTTIAATKAEGADIYYFKMPNANASLTVTSATNLASNSFNYQIESLVYTGSAVVLPNTITVTSSTTGDATITQDTDYTIEGYKDAKKQALNSAPINVGTYYVTIKGKGAYAGTKDVEFTITKATPSITLRTDHYEMEVGDKVTITVTSTVPEGLTLSFKSEKEKVATVDAKTGSVTAVAEGTAEITISTTGNDNYAATSVKCTITVKDNAVGYGIFIGQKEVTDKNSKDIFGDGDTQNQKPASFTYNPDKNTLIVCNSQDEYIIECNKSEGLTLYLAPMSSNKIGKIINTSQSADSKLTITTDGNYPGALTLSPADQSSIIQFSKLVLEQNLSILKPENVTYANGKLSTGQELTIAVPMTPITYKKEITPDATIEEGQTDDNINKIVNDVLYTLGNTNDPDGDGFDDVLKCIVINSVTTDEGAKEVSVNLTPGTIDFLEHLKGLTFLVPAGKGKITIVAQTEDGYKMKVKIGETTPFTIEKPEKGDVIIPYNVEEPTFVYIYNGGKSGSKARSKGISKGGKKSVTHVRVYGTTVTPSKVNPSNSVSQVSGNAYEGIDPNIDNWDDGFAPVEGDVNGDYVVDGNDVRDVVNYIKGFKNGSFDKYAADMNHDNVINIADIIMILKIINK